MKGVQSSVFHTLLPTEVITKIFEYLSPREILIASLACKLFHEIASDNLLWKNLCLRENILWDSPSSWKEVFRECRFSKAKKEFMQIVRAKPNLQPIDPKAYDFKLNGKQGIAILESGKRVYQNFSKNSSISDSMGSRVRRTQALFDGHWLVQSSRDDVDECDLETGKVKRNFNLPKSYIQKIVGFQNFFTFDHFSRGLHLWDIRNQGNAPCLTIPLSDCHRRPQIINSEQILVTYDEASKIHVIDLRNISSVQTIAPPDHNARIQKYVKVASFVHERGQLIVSYNSGMLAEYSLSRHEFTSTALKTEWTEAILSVLNCDIYDCDIYDYDIDGKIDFEKLDSALEPADSSYDSLKVCDSIIVGEKHTRYESDWTSSGLNFIHRYSFKVLGSLRFERNSAAWDYQERRFAHKTDRNKLQIWDF